jgi:hypothetical protein
VYLRYIQSAEPLVSSSPLSSHPSIASFPCSSQEQGVGSCSQKQGVSSWRHGYLETNMDNLDQEELPVSESAVEEEEGLEEGGLQI